MQTDLPAFCANSLKIRPKAGPLQPFVLNAAQLKLHEIIEAQKKKTGRVRIIVLKSRQLGISTYVAARFYRHTITNPGIRTIIIGHERRASSNLFEIVRRFHDAMPEDIRPSVGTSNAESLLFDRLDSGYVVSVANDQGTGRSATAQCLHASEVAFWADLQAQLAGLLQTVPDIDGSEVILESTANSFNAFHSLWRKAEANENEFECVFLPWWFDSEYQKEVGPDFQMEAEEANLADVYDLTKEQIFWRRRKVAQLGDPQLFNQEYPSSPTDAFISPSFDSFIRPELVVRARKQTAEPIGPLVVGCDPGHLGGDRTAVAWRRGRVILKVESRRDLDTMGTAGLLQRIINEEKPARINIDATGLGVGVFDRLYETSSNRRIIRAINFASKPAEPPQLDERGNPVGGCANRRAEMWFNLRKALEAGRFCLPNKDSLQADLTSVGYKYNSSGQLLLESKENLRKRGLPSPDEGDAIALCFADPSGDPINADFHRDLRERYQGAYV